MGTDCDSCGNTPEEYRYVCKHEIYEIWITDSCVTLVMTVAQVSFDFDKQNFVL